MVTGYKRPTLKELNEHVISQYATYWDRIGMQLGVTGIDIIEKDNSQDCIACFRKALQKWLNATEHATWKMLEDAINIVLKPGD